MNEREPYIPQRVPSQALAENDQEDLRSALNVIAGVHRASKTAQGPAPRDRKEKRVIENALQIGEEKVLRRWATTTNKFLSEEPFTDAWRAQNEEGGAEHKVYVQRGIYYKRNNLNYYGTWLSYFHNLLLHNWLFPQTGYTFLGLMDVDGALQAVVSQKAIRGARGATVEEVNEYMAHFEFVRRANNEYVNTDFGVIVSDLHHRNVLIDNEGDLLVFDPVIYVMTPFEIDPT